MVTMMKQLALKPQDLVVAMKLSVNSDREFILTGLSNELGMVVSAIHGSIVRCEQARLLSRVAGPIQAIKPAILEFALHGARYAFPAVQGTLTRGIGTSIAGPSLRKHFDQAKAMPLVWPDPAGDAYGPGIAPLHPIVLGAAKADAKLLDALTLLDAIRVGAARERELAKTMLEERLS